MDADDQAPLPTVPSIGGGPVAVCVAQSFVAEPPSRASHQTQPRHIENTEDDDARRQLALHPHSSTIARRTVRFFEVTITQNITQRKNSSSQMKITL